MIINTPKILVIVIILIISISILFLTYLPNTRISEDFEFEIKEGEGSISIADKLKDKGVIRSRSLFVAYTIVRSLDKELKAGKYLLSTSMNMPKMAKIFAKGLTINTDIKVTIPEGFNVWEINERLKNAGLIADENFVSKALKYEGYLFPDTYKFKEDVSANEIIDTISGNFNKRTSELARTPTEEEIIMASIIEKEVRAFEDMKIVSGILWKRRDAGQLLQVDATVTYNYCILESADDCDTAFIGVRAILKKEGPYNTYVNQGLPEAPISNPGINSIVAAMNPQDSPYWYYLNAKKEDGRTIFSKTGVEHEANRQIYILD